VSIGSFLSAHTEKTQGNHIFAAIFAYVKLEMLNKIIDKKTRVKYYKKYKE